MALAAQFIAINPWVTQTELPLKCQEKVAHLKLQAWPGKKEVQRTAVATAGICAASLPAKPRA